MKNALFMIIALSLAPFVYADETPNVVATLIDHVHTETTIDLAGNTRLALEDSIVRTFPFKGTFLLEGQAGFSGNTAPKAGEAAAADLVAGLLFRVDPLLNSSLSFPAHWSFLQSVEHGLVYGYDFRERHGYLGYQFNLAFALNPVK